MENQQLPENENIQNSKANLSRILLGSIIFILVGIFILLIVLKFTQNKEKTTTYILQTMPTDEPKPTTTSTPSPTQSPMAHWSLYASKYLGASFQYPADWKVKIDEASLPGVEAISIQSPEGLTINFSPEVSGLGGGCVPPNCPLVKTRKVTKLENTNSLIDLYLVEGGVDTMKRFGLMSAVNKGPIPTVGEKKEFPYYVLFSTKKNSQGWFLVNATEPKYIQMTDEEFFNLPEVKTAEMVISSFKYL